MSRKQRTPPFALSYSADGRLAYDSTVDWLFSLSPEVAQKFATTVPVELAALCQRWGDGFRPLPDEPSTLRYSRPVFQQLIRLSARRRRSNAGVWRFFYDVIDDDGDGKPDTIRILSVRHAAARLFSLTDDDE